MGSEILFERVLLIEDESAHALLITRALRDYCREVKHVASAAEALQLLPGIKPDLVISDLKLPDSVDAAHVERIVDVAPGLPVIVLTSSSALSDAINAMKRGAKDFLVKNFDSEFKNVLGLSLARLYSQLALEAEKRKLEREMGALRQAIEGSDDGLAVLDSSGQVGYSNSAYRSFVKVCGGTVGDFLAGFSTPVEKVDLLRAQLEAKRCTLPVNSVWSTEVTFVGEKTRAFELSLSVIGNDTVEADPVSRGCVVWVKDATERRRREKFQRELLSTTTHDLKGPLGAILISAEMLTEMSSGQKQIVDLVLRVASSAQGAINLIDEFLSARRIQEGSLILRPTRQEIGAVLMGVLNDFKPIAAARSIDLSSSVEGEVFAEVDKLGITRVVGNLLSNALKFTPKKGRVCVSARRQGDEVHIQVTDSGAGMETADVQRLFQRFSRLEKHNEVEGTGLGLFVVKSIVAAHGGKINVTSKVGEGSTFDIILPVKPPVNDRGELVSLDLI